MNIYLYHLLDENEKVRYVGVTLNVKRRMGEHKRTFPKHTFEVIAHFDNKQDAGLAEQNHIKLYDTINNGWNKTIGGETILSGENHPRYKHGLSGTKEFNQKYYQDNKDKLRKKMKIYYEENIDEIKEYKRKWRQENKAHILEQAKQYREKIKKLKFLCNIVYLKRLQCSYEHLFDFS